MPKMYSAAHEAITPISIHSDRGSNRMRWGNREMRSWDHLKNHTEKHIKFVLYSKKCQACQKKWRNGLFVTSGLGEIWTHYQYWRILYIGLFLPLLFSPFYNCKRFHPILDLPRYSCVNKDIICNIEFAQSSIRPLTMRAKGVKIKRGRIFPWIQ